MKIIPANQAVPFRSDQAAGSLLVGMTVFDLTTGTPVQVVDQAGQVNDVYPMTQLGSSNSYFAFFRGAPNRVYMMLYQVFTSGAYTTPTGDSISETVAAKVMQPVFVQGLEVLVGCEEQKNQKQVTFSQNSEGSMVLSFVDEDGREVDISAATALAVSILEADGETILTKTLSDGVSLVDGAYNRALVTFSADDLGDLASGSNDVQVSLTLNGVATVLMLLGVLDLEPGLPV